MAGALAVLPHPAMAAATITLDEDTGVLRIVSDDAADRITTLQDSSNVIVTGSNLSTSAPCAGTTSVTCPLPPTRMIAVDLDEGDDVFASSAT